MKVLYHIGEEIGSETIVKRGLIDEKISPLKLVAEDEIVFNDIQSIDFYKLNGLGTMIKLKNGADTIFLAVPRLYLNIGTGFAIINYFATKKLKNILELGIKS